MEKKYLQYEDFGAIGDGVHDDFPSIIACHEEANRTGTPVKARDGARYYIGGSQNSAIIRTDVDFGTATVIIDDRAVEKNDSYVFRIMPDYERYEIKLGSLGRGDRRVDFEHEGNAIVTVFNDNSRVYIRKGLNSNSGVAATEVFTVDRDGNIGEPLNRDYPTVTRAYARRIDDTPITVRGGKFITVANRQESLYRYLQRGFEVVRAHVTMCDFEHYVEGELDHGAPYHGFIRSNGCVDLTVRDAIMTPRFIYWTESTVPGTPVRMGSYDLSFWSSIGVRCINIKQSIDIYDDKYWGIYTSNFCKNLIIEDCVLSRFDAHMGVTNATIRRCKLGHQAARLIGNGEFLMEDTEIFTKPDDYFRDFLYLRADYGSSFDGNITIRNCVWHTTAKDARVIGSLNDGDHDYGYPCYMGRNIVIDGLRIINGKNTPKENTQITLFARCDGALSDRSYPYILPQTVTYGGITFENGAEFRISPSPENFARVKITKKEN